VDVIPNGVDLTRFVPEPREAARVALGWPQDEEVLLFAGHPDELRKNFPLARKTQEELRRTGRRVRLEVFHNRPQVELVRVMNASDVLLLPSFHEGSPNVVKEAMAVNLPVVSTDVGDCRELLQDVEPSDVTPRVLAAFALSVEEVLDEKRRSNGRAVIERRLSLEAVAKRVLGVYEAALAKGRR
jgi:glycosyltransferase involved in cell wall biosynthesis